MKVLDIKKRVMIKELMDQGYINIKIEGNSMAPLVLNNEIVEICNLNTIQIGDVILWLREDGIKIILHRVIAIQDEFLITKGDNLNVLDHPIHIHDVIGGLRPERVELNSQLSVLSKEHKEQADRVLDVYKRMLHRGNKK